MTIDILIEALDMLSKQDDLKNYKAAEICKSLKELYRLREKCKDGMEFWQGAIHVISMSDATEIQNMLLYDTYGKLARKAGKSPSFVDFCREAAKVEGFAEATSDFLESGYNLLNDLWHDNEVNGYNSSDGTYKKVKTAFQFKILNSDYVNTGGNTMVGVFEVWMPEENRTVYMYVNEEGAGMSTVDYIRNDTSLDDYDEVQFGNVEWSSITGNEKYFELYKQGLMTYLKDDCKRFGYIKSLPYFLLSEELQSSIDDDYREYIEEEYDGLFDTDGYKVLIKDTYKSNKALKALKDFKKWHDSTACNEEFYSDKYELNFAGRTVCMPFNADIWDAIDNLLLVAIEDYN